MTKITQTDFHALVVDAYGHLYDLVYLRSHALLDIIVPDLTLSAKQRGWELHRLLLDATEELKPPPQAPAFSRHWRRYELMGLRYVKALDPQAVAEELSISRRHFYREHKIALEAIGDILWRRYGETTRSAGADGSALGSPDEPPAELGRLELLRLEAARLGQARRLSHLPQVVAKARPLLQSLLERNAVTLDIVLPDDMPWIAVDERLLRQVLLGLMSYLVGSLCDVTLRLDVVVADAVMDLRLRIQPPAAAPILTSGDAQERIGTFREMLTMGEGELRVIYDETYAFGFDLVLPIPDRIVLVVDDNEDVLALFQRYLKPYDFRVVTANNADRALDLATRLQPYAMTVDLMMPEGDGWDLIQMLLNQPQTQSIPIIVCSVLNQKELALSLGATAFLSKPVTEQTLLAALQALA